jgi:hypothetical protein
MDAPASRIATEHQSKVGRFLDELKTKNEDWERDVDFKPITAALRQVGYKGFVSVGVFNFDEGAEAIASRSLDYLKRTFA